MIIDNFLKYQIEWLTSHNDIEFNKEEEDLIIRFLRDTAEMYQRENECEDCISRQAVDTLVDELARAISDERCCMSRGRSTATIMQDILDLPSVTPQPTRWIPVSERLPKTFEFANCTCHSLIDDREDWVVETVYIPQPPDSPYSDWGNIPMLNEGNCEVVAWMHRDIPQPYKAESEE